MSKSDRRCKVCGAVGCTVEADLKRIRKQKRPGNDMPAGRVRQFGTGATRDADTGKPDYDGFFSPLVVERFGRYMHKHRLQPDGALRDADNWQKGIPPDQYMKSLWRHLVAAWTIHRGFPCVDENGALVDIEEALCGVLFNTQGYLHELLKAKKDTQ